MKATNFLKALLVTAACLFLYSCDMAYDMGGVFMPDASYDEAMPGEPEEHTGGDKFDEIVENDFIKTADQNVSTFSIDADGATYAYMRKCLRNGFLPSPNAVRIEESI